MSVLDDLSTGRAENLAHHGEVERLTKDLRDPEACAAACRDVEIVFHQAALGSVPRSLADPATTIAVNVAGTATLFAAARDAGVRRVVYASSSSVYGTSPELPKREGQEGAPLSPYATSKSMCEDLAAVFGRCFGLEMIGLRYFNVYGPRQRPDGPYAAVVPRFVAAALDGLPPVIYGDGEQSRDFTWVGDAVQANLLAATAPAAAVGRAFNVAGGRRVDLLELARRVRDAAGGGPEPRHEAPRPGDVRHSLASLEAVEEALGYLPTISLADGIRATLEHARRVAAVSTNAAASRIAAGSTATG